MTDYFKNFKYPGLPQMFTPNPGTQNQSEFRNLAKSDLLRIGSHLTGILADRKVSLDPPQLVVVGTQSSGKSSLLNRLIDMEILPMGKSMVTRCPLNLQLNTSDKAQAEFGEYIEGLWRSTKKIDMTPGTAYQEAIACEIETQTVAKAGPGQNISHTPIILKISGPHLPTLSLVDTMGLTSVACVDKGQPVDIKDQIRQLVGSYIKSPRSIILLVMAARSDLEVDQGFELAKEYDPKGERTVGVITKVDLMNVGTDVSDYISNQNISKSLELKHGYFAVKNKGPEFKDNESVNDQELQYFKSHPIYGTMTSFKQFGIGDLTHSLTEILSDHIRQTLPFILSEVNQIEASLDQSLKEIGSSMPDKESDLDSMAHLLMSNFCRTFVSALEDKGGILNYGRHLKDIFVAYRQEINQLSYDFSDALIAEAIASSEGNHMLSVPSIEVIEYTLRSTPDRNSPLQLFYAPSVACLDKIAQLLSKLVDDVAKVTQIHRFANLTSGIKREMVNNVCNQFHQRTLHQIQALIKIEENYIWTDDTQFQLELQKLYQNLKPGQINYSGIRTLINGYFACTKRNCADRVPKEIMYHFIKNIENEVSHSLFEKLTRSTTVHKLLEESPHIAQRRKILTEQKAQLKAVKTLIETC